MSGALIGMVLINPDLSWILKDPVVDLVVFAAEDVGTMNLNAVGRHIDWVHFQGTMI
jgi:hypothetical protein